MNHSDTAPWLDVLDYVARQKDAPKHVRDAAPDALEVYGKAVEIYTELTATWVKHRDTHYTAQRSQLGALETELRQGKRADVVASCTHVTKLHSHATTAEQHKDIATQLLAGAARLVRTTIARDDDAVLQWIAQRRCSVPTQCGDVDVLPDQVQFLYRELSADWLQPWDDELTMHHHRRLQLTYDDTWSVPFRASHTWLWQQLAQGDVERTKAGKLRPLRRVRELPQVPDATPTPPAPIVRPF